MWCLSRGPSITSLLGLVIDDFCEDTSSNKYMKSPRGFAVYLDFISLRAKLANRKDYFRDNNDLGDKPC